MREDVAQQSPTCRLPQFAAPLVHGWFLSGAVTQIDNWQTALQAKPAIGPRCRVGQLFVAYLSFSCNPDFLNGGLAGVPKAHVSVIASSLTS